ncbi:MAG: thioredoxin family protein [Bacteroidota bacterium]
MKYPNLLFAFFLLPTLLAGQGGVRFQVAPEWQSILEQAQKQGKMIFLDASTSWCVPCKKMEKEVFTRQDVGQFVNQNFIAVQYDMDKGEGFTLKGQYGVSVFPTYLFLDWNGAVVHLVVGALFEEGAFLRQARLAFSPGESYGALSARYRNGERQPSMMFKYMDVLRTAGQVEQAEALAQSYLDRVSVDHFKEADYWGIIHFLLKEPASREFKILYENQAEIGAAIGNRAVADKIFSVFENKILENSRYRAQDGVAFDTKAEDEMIEMLRQAEFSRCNELLAKALLVRHHRRNDWENVAYVLDALLDFDVLKGSPDPAGLFHENATVFAETIEDGRLLRRALRWSEEACRIEKRPAALAKYLATKADLLEKMGLAAEAAEARAAAEKAEKSNSN